MPQLLDIVNTPQTPQPAAKAPPPKAPTPAAQGPSDKPTVEQEDQDSGFDQTLAQQQRQTTTADDRQQQSDVSAEEAQPIEVNVSGDELDNLLQLEVAGEEGTEGLLVSEEFALQAAQLNAQVSLAATSKNASSPQQEGAVKAALNLQLVAQVANTVDAALANADSEGSAEKSTASILPVTLESSKEAKAKGFGAALERQSGIPVPVGEQNWSKQFADRVLVLTQQGLSSAKLHLNPAELGPLEIRISVQQDQATVSISSAHALVRDSVEQSIPRLRELLEQEGLKLLDVDVHSQSQQQQQANEDTSSAATEGGSDEEVEAEVVPNQIVSNNAVDYYA